MLSLISEVESALQGEDRDAFLKCLAGVFEEFCEDHYDALVVRAPDTLNINEQLNALALALDDGQESEYSLNASNGQ